jgi:hypothetical protein
MLKGLVDIDLRKSIPLLSVLAAFAGLFVVGNPPTMTFDHLVSVNCIPTALQIAKMVALGAPIIAGAHSLAATVSPRVEGTK